MVSLRQRSLTAGVLLCWAALLLERKFVLWVICPFVPHHPGGRAVLSFRNEALKIRVLDRMILGPYSQPLDSGVERRPLGHGPGCQDSVHLQPEVVVQPGRIMLLDYKDAVAARAAPDATGGFGCLTELPLSAVFLEWYSAPQDFGVPCRVRWRR